MGLQQCLEGRQSGLFDSCAAKRTWESFTRLRRVARLALFHSFPDPLPVHRETNGLEEKADGTPYYPSADGALAAIGPKPYLVENQGQLGLARGARILHTFLTFRKG